MMYLPARYEIELASLNRHELERRLELARLVREGRPPRLVLRRRLLGSIGSVLIAWGEALCRITTLDRPIA